MVRVKICGITSIQDALKAIEYGADALGFILAESPREISIDRLKKISLMIPPFVDKVGVFVNRDVSVVKKLLRDGDIDYAQLHGDEDIEYCKKLPLRKVIRVIRPRDVMDIKDAYVFREVGAILIDSFVPERRGGTGHISDWRLAIKAKDIGPRLILSGGLNARNVRKAIAEVRPYAVDVSSGVERTPGKKDYNILRLFIQRAKGA